MMASSDLWAYSMAESSRSCFLCRRLCLRGRRRQTVSCGASPWPSSTPWIWDRKCARYEPLIWCFVTVKTKDTEQTHATVKLGDLGSLNKVAPSWLHGAGWRSMTKLTTNHSNPLFSTDSCLKANGTFDIKKNSNIGRHTRTKLKCGTCIALHFP